MGDKSTRSGKKGAWSSLVHLPPIKTLPSWSTGGLIKRSSSVTRSASGSPRSSPSPEPSVARKSSSSVGEEAVDHTDEHEANEDYGQGEVKESLIQLLSGCYHDAAHKRSKKLRSAKSDKQESPASIHSFSADDESSVASTSTLTPPLTSGSSDDEPDEEEDGASDSELSILSSTHSSNRVDIGNSSSPEANLASSGSKEFEGVDAKTPSQHSVTLPVTSEDLETGSLQNNDKIEPEHLHSLSFVNSKAGTWPNTHGHEVLLASVPAVQCRSVMIKGTLFITNKRLVFYAWIALDKEADETTVLQEGVLTFVYPQKWKPSRRVYCVLSPYGVASYTSSTDRLHPRSARSLSAFKEVTMDLENPLRFKVEELNGSYRWVQTDTVEHTRQWYNAMQAALFRYRYRSDHVVLSVPFSRVEAFKYDDIMDFCKVMQFDINCSTKESPNAGEELRPVLLGVSRHSWHVLPQIQDLLERNKITQEPKQAIIASEPEVIISFDSGERRTQVDKYQGSSKNLAADFVQAFGLEDDPEDLYITSVEVLRPYPDYGHIAVSRDYLCFWRRSLLGEDSKSRISMSAIDDVYASKNYRLHVYGMTVQLHAAKDIKYEFHSMKNRDECVDKITQRLEEYERRHQKVESEAPAARTDSPISEIPSNGIPHLAISPPSTPSGKDAHTPPIITSPERQASAADPNIRIPPHALPCLGTIINLPAEARLKIPPRHFVLMTIGSRGDVQPYIALGKRLVQEGHRVTIASHEEYQGWAMSHGLEYKCIGGSPTALMQLSVEHKMFSPGFFRESLGKFRQWFDDLLRECWAACQEADVLIESPTAFAGIHIADALAIPYFRAFTMPWTSTAAYPQAFAPVFDAGPAYNSLSYSIFDKVLWQASAGQINRWRKNTLRIKPTTFEKMQQRQVPFIYNFSQAVVPPPLDWSSLIRISGYWFLDQPDLTWQPEQSLLDFMQKARTDNVPLVYAGFGSITIKDVEAVIEHIYEAALTANVRVILSRGWSARNKDGTNKQVQLKHPPPNVYLVESIPHDWLFPQIDAAMHHGGAGTTGASLRAGLPTIIKPFFGDQFFWATRVQKLGVGIRLPSLAANDIAKAFSAATRTRIMQEKAEDVGKRIRSEDGCGDAMNFVYGLLSSAERQAKERHKKSMLHEGDKVTSFEDQDDELLKLATDRLRELTIGIPTPERSRSISHGTTTPQSERSHSQDRLVTTVPV